MMRTVEVTGRSGEKMYSTLASSKFSPQSSGFRTVA